MSKDLVEPTNYETTAEVDGAASEFAMTKGFIAHDFVVDKKPTQDEVQKYRDVLSTSQFSNTLWMDMAVTKWWSGSKYSFRSWLRFLRFPFLWVLAMSLMVYFPTLLIEEYWPTGIQCLTNQHGWTTILASEAVIIYLFSMTGYTNWTMSDDKHQERSHGTWSLYIMLSSHTTRHCNVVILGYIADILCRGFLITATAWSLIYNDPELEEILIRGVEMDFLMEIPHVLRFMSEERLETMLVSAYAEKGAKFPNYEAWKEKNKWLVRFINVLQGAAVVWSVLLPLGMLLCM